MKPKFLGCARQLTEFDISELEQKIEIKLPCEYRDFLLECNNGSPEPYCFPIENCPQCGKFGWLHLFFGIDSMFETYNIENNYQVYKNRIPSDCLPIAMDPGGNIICLAISGPNAGYVWFGYHNFENPEADHSNCYKIANSFDEFINSFCEI
jgi:cell wall assembly regulator SMI1